MNVIVGLKFRVQHERIFIKITPKNKISCFLEDAKSYVFYILPETSTLERKWKADLRSTEFL